MAIAIKREVTVDFQIPKQVSTLTFLQYDTNIIKFFIEDNGETANLNNITNIIVNFRRPDKHIVSQVLTKNGNEIEYKLTPSEMSVVGVCEMVLQLFDNEDRVSIAKFKVIIDENIENGEEPSVEDVSLITQLVENVNARVAELATFGNRLTTNENALNTKLVAEDLNEINGKVTALESALSVDATETTLKVNKLAVVNKSRTLQPTFTTDIIKTVTERNVATPVIQVDVSDNSSHVLIFHYGIDIIGSNSVVRYVEGGTLRLVLLKVSSEALRYTISVDEKNTLGSGTSVITFSGELVGELSSNIATLIVKLAVDSSWMGSARFRTVLVSALRHNNNSVITALS